MGGRKKVKKCFGFCSLNLVAKIMKQKSEFKFKNILCKLVDYSFYVKKCCVHPVYGAGIQTHDLRNTSLLPITTTPGNVMPELTSATCTDGVVKISKPVANVISKLCYAVIG